VRAKIVSPPFHTEPPPPTLTQPCFTQSVQFTSFVLLHPAAVRTPLSIAYCDINHTATKEEMRSIYSSIQNLPHVIDTTDWIEPYFASPKWRAESASQTSHIRVRLWKD